MVRFIASFLLVTTPVFTAVFAQVPHHHTDQFGTGGRETRGAMAVDACGCIYIAGTTTGSWSGHSPNGGYDAWLAKLTRNGRLIWVRQWGGPEREEVMAVAVDWCGRIFVTGYLSIGDGSTSWIRAFDSAGRSLWERHFKLCTAAFAHGICTDRCGNVYVTGAAAPEANPSIPIAFLQKRGSSGNLIWSRTIGQPGRTGARGYGVEADRAERIYVTGQVWGDLDDCPELGGGDGFLRRFDSAGNIVWTRRYGTDKFDMSRAVAVDRCGHIYVGGSDFLSEELRQIPKEAVPEEAMEGPERISLDAVGSLRKFDSYGTELMDNIYPDRWDVRDLAISSSGQVLMAGFGFASLQDSSDGNTLWFDSLPFWTKDAGVTGDYNLISGTVRGSLNGQPPVGTQDAFVIRYSTMQAAMR